jgi:xanthine dehydrogenase small subunit
MTTIRPIHFWHQGQVRQVSTAKPIQTLLDWLRDDAHCTGTKEGCAEGDCGACTVSVGELDADGRLQLKPVNSCIQFLPSLDGKALFTVEDLKQGEQLHPVQQCMVDCHASQCGFCTPGFVMTLWTSWEEADQAPSRQQLADQLAGNLCRCTGYRPILDAGEQAFASQAPKLDRKPVEQALQQLQQLPPLDTGTGFHAPRTLQQLAQLRHDKPDARLLAGSTDIGLWVTKQFRELGELIYLGRVAELQAIHEDAEGLHIGAGASLDAAWGALAARWPSLTEIWLRFASPPLRSTGTMGGNVANGSPIGDAAPVLIALDAEVELQKLMQTRRIQLADFYVDYMKNRLEPGEFLRAIHVPPNTGWQLQAHKISKRFDSDISAVCGALAVRMEGERIADLRLAWGGMAAIVKRSAAAEAALRGQPWSEANLAAAQAALAQDFSPLSDMRASQGYRLQVAQNLLRRLMLSQQLPAEQLSVWSAR